jgi:hypothetical protein
METYKSIHSGLQDIMHIKFDGTTENAHVFSFKHREVTDYKLTDKDFCNSDLIL